MKNLSEAIKGVFIALTAGVHNDFYNDVQGQLFKGRAPPGTQYPYAVFALITVVPFRTFSERFENSLIQFSLFSSTSSSSEVEDMFTHLKTLFDDAEFDIAQNVLVWCRYESATLIPDIYTTTEGTIDIWHYAVDFEVKMQAKVYIAGTEIDWATGIAWEDGIEWHDGWV